ncbi:PD-(D/E)XK nuclease superfamily protein [Thermomonospora echinospora]|uniref:PD-(D/E)XK nuclease superfamily protein n=1 Tax=Thermomonospora echinospora TaxID=1992 RepID=A0A1H6D603_9ACTN|nr:PD-(D/E)XK nuclease family protein [Thermomonospora echinospora]SEG80760.1 PD-(D/E)XK nuclease superfamily protein [Thermomonospora echinospora]
MGTDRWAAHPGLRGNSEVMRISASLLDRTERDCADFAALKARTALWPRAFERRRYAPWETFPLGLVQRALDAVEFDGAEVDEAVADVIAGNRSPVHPGVGVWVEHACRAFLQAAEWIADELESEGVEPVPERLPRVVQSGSAAELRMLTAWGRWYGSRDGTVREFRRLRMSRTRPVAAPSDEAIAFVAAAGRRAVGDLYRDAPVDVVDDEDAPTRVRVVEVALAADVRPRVLVDDSPDQVRRRYLERVRPLAQGITVGGERRPGPDCVECKLQASCEDLPRVPGLLGLDDPGTHRRTWSVTTGRHYLVCPARAHLRDVYLPAETGVEGTSVRRGVAVHQWLEAAHSRGRPCAPADLPDADADDLGLAAGVMTPEEYREARPYLLTHLPVCPLAGPGPVTDVSAEPTVAVFDPAADVLVVAHPDLLRRVDGRLVYREQKTTVRELPAGTPGEVFEQVPQLALAVLLIAHGVFGAGGGMVELEVMTPSLAQVMAFDAADAKVLDAARRQITRMVHGWHRDTEFAPSPGPWCERCPVARWCPAPRASPPTGTEPIEVDGVLIDPLTGEVLDAPVPLTGRAAAVSATLGDPDPEADPPF